MSGGRTIARRVARAMAATAVLSGLLSAALATVIAWTSMLDREDGRLRGAAQTLAVEVPPAMDDAAARAHADDEQTEVAVAGMRIALYRGARFVGGDASLRPSAAGGCRTDGPSRRCRFELPTGAIEVASGLAGARAQRSLLLGASLAAALLAGLAGLGLSGAVSARIVRPLQRLREEVAAVDADAPGRALPGGGDGYAETDALRAALGEMLARLDGALSQSRRFAADAAHELRTPLGTMRAELELAAEADDIPGEVRDAQGRALRTLGGLTALVERLLILAAPDDPLRAAREAVSLAEVVDEALAGVDPAARARVRATVDDRLHVRGDAVLLRAMLENVLGNALKFAPAGEVTVHAEADGDDAVVAVTDAGPGVPAGDRARVFDAFYRSAGARADGVPGHGVGLALVARIARAHGGSAAFEDAPSGARLVLRLPRWRPA